jgi:hypothetical protein
VASLRFQDSAIESSGGNYIDREQADRQSRTPHIPKKINWVYLEIGFDVDGDDYPEEICLHYHRESQTLMSIRYNQNSDLRRTYRHANYVPIEYSWAGIGVAKQTEQFMKEITTQHRQRIDNGTIVNCRMIKIHRDAGYADGEPVYPGKIWFVDDMSHVDSFQLGEIYNSAYNNENASLIFLQQRTGINELTLGMPQQGTPGTATGDITRVQESQNKSGWYYKNLKQFVDDIILDTASAIHQFGSRTLRYADMGAQQVLTLPEQDLRDGLILKLKSVGQADNKLVDRNNWQVLSQLIQQYYTGMLQLAQFSGNQQLIAALVNQGMISATETMKLILSAFDVPNTDKFTLEKVIQQMMGMNNANPQGMQPGGTPGLIGAGIPTGMGGPPPQVG